MFYQLYEFKLDTLLINHLIIENNLYGMVTRRSLRDVPHRHCFFNFTFYFITILARYTEVNYQLTQSFYQEYLI